MILLLGQILDAGRLGSIVLLGGILVRFYLFELAPSMWANSEVFSFSLFLVTGLGTPNFGLLKDVILPEREGQPF